MSELPFLHSYFPGFLINSVIHNKKAVRGKIAWLKSPVRHRTLAPFGGITRIRFKGSSSWTSQPLRLPRTTKKRIKEEVKSKSGNCCAIKPRGASQNYRRAAR